MYSIKKTIPVVGIMHVVRFQNVVILAFRQRIASFRRCTCVCRFWSFVEVEIACFNLVVVKVIESVDLRREQTQCHHGTVEDEGERQQGRLVIGIEGDKVGGQEGDPHKQCCRHRYEDIPALVEIVGQFPRQEPKSGAEDEQENVVGEWHEQVLKGQTTQELDVRFAEDRHLYQVFWWEEGCHDHQKRHLEGKSYNTEELLRSLNMKTFRV